jgi:hypothetical protein
VYIKIRQGRLAMFVPFCNLNYQNSWAGQFKGALPKEGLQAYYAQKQAASGKREEEVLQDVSQWWANGNILCNEQVRHVWPTEYVGLHGWPMEYGIGEAGGRLCCGCCATLCVLCVLSLRGDC